MRIVGFVLAVSGWAVCCWGQSVEPIPLDDVSQRHLIEQQRHWAIEQLEASYISNFPYYVQWPAEVFIDHPQALYIGLIGKDVLGHAGREYLAQHGYLDFHYVVEEVEGPYDEKTLDGYQMLYLGHLPDAEMRHILSLIANKPILTMSREPHFLHNGGMIQMKVTQNAVTWEVDPQHASKAGMRLDPRLATYGQEMSQPWQNTP